MESDASAIRARIDVVSHRLAALADRGVDTSPLATRLQYARDSLEGGEVVDAQSLTEEVASGARRLATVEAKAAGEVRGVVRDQLVSEVREALQTRLTDEVAQQQVQQVMKHVDVRLAQFEHRLRDQFAREFAQVLSSKPWLHDMPLDSSGSRRKAVAAEPVGERKKSDSAVSSLSGPRVAIDVSALRDQVSGLRKRIDVSGTVEQRLDEALTDIAASEEGVMDLVANVAELQAQLGDRVVALEQELAAIKRTSATLATVTGSETTITRLHVSTGNSGVKPSVSTEAETNADGGFAGQTTTPAPDSDKIAVEFPARPDTSQWNNDPASQMIQDALESALADMNIQPDGGQSLLGQDASGLTPVHKPGSDSLAARPITQPAGTSGALDPNLAITSDADVDDHGSSRFPVRSARASTPEGSGVNEFAVRKLIEERLETWRPVQGEGLVMDEEEQIQQLVHLLPQAMEDSAVRTALFATIALEAIERPGALAHLTKLRSFLRDEIALAAEQVPSKA